MQALIFLLIPLALYFAMVRPQRQRLAAQRALVNALVPGARVVTAGGILGTLVSMDEHEAKVELAPGVVVGVLPAGIVRRLDVAPAAGPTGEADGAEGLATADGGDHLVVPDDLSGLTGGIAAGGLASGGGPAAGGGGPGGPAIDEHAEDAGASGEHRSPPRAEDD